MNILIGIPSSGLVNSAFALDNLPAIIGYAHRNLPQVNLLIAYQCGVRTDRNRNIILESALKQGNIDAILWLDEDMLYPHDIIACYLEHDFEIIGCLYFKRAKPHDPIGYIKGNNPLKPYLALDPSGIPANKDVIDVDALGYGGMMVKMSVYEKMGDKKWTHYGENYHLPYPCENKLTHDLQFCKDAQECGVSIKLHTKVRPGHIGEKVVTAQDWQPIKTSKITVIMPAIDMELATKAGKLMKQRAGVECELVIVEDVNRSGFMATLQAAIDQNPSDFYVYTAQDAYVGRNWLKTAYDTIEQTQAGLLAFNDGKWQGQIAAFGLVRRSWMVQNYGGRLFFEGYQTHYGDAELTLIAKAQGKYAYNPDAVMTEVDYSKEGKGTNPKDKALFGKRKLSGFDGRVTNTELLDSFS